MRVSKSEATSNPCGEGNGSIGAPAEIVPTQGTSKRGRRARVTYSGRTSIDRAAYGIRLRTFFFSSARRC